MTAHQTGESRQFRPISVDSNLTPREQRVEKLAETMFPESKWRDGEANLQRSTSPKELGVQHHAKKEVEGDFKAKDRSFAVSSLSLLCGNSVRASENRAFGRGLATRNAVPRTRWLLKRNATHGCACFFLDLGFAVSATAPRRQRETGLDGLL